MDGQPNRKNWHCQANNAGEDRRSPIPANAVWAFKEGCEMRQRYCVYSHSLDGAVFYVGLGAPSRPYIHTARSPRWNSHVNNRYEEIETLVLSWHQDREEAKEAERLAIATYQPVANKQLVRIGKGGPKQNCTYVKDGYLGIRLEKRHKHLIIAAAKEANKGLSEYIVDTLLLVAAGEYIRKGAK
jgi:hypothetical protein